jgi:DNA-binding NarL/FixJ family response regulator
MTWQGSEGAAPIYYEALTPRQKEVLDVLVDGAPTNRHIAARLAISRYTVERHLSDIYQKLGVSSRYEAILWWLRYRQSLPKDG